MIARALRILLAGAALVGVAATAAAAQDAGTPARPYLKSHVTVTSNVVRIGDLIENAGVVANVPIFRAPDLGTTGSVPADAVAEAVRSHALVGLDTAGLSEVMVTRASREIPIGEIQRSLAQALTTRFNLGPIDDITVAFDRDPRSIQVDPAAKGEVSVGRVTYDKSNGRFDALLEVPTGAAQRGILRLAGRAFASVEVVMVSHGVERGTVLRTGDLTIERRPRSEIGRDILSGIGQATGLAARNALRPGQPLRSADLAKPEVVQRNEMVTLVFQAPGLTLTMRGKSLDAGAEGDTVSVLNEQSKRTVQGVVAGPGHVVVLSTTPRLAANIPVAEEPAR
ncbi:MAG: flagellar basal body P-ring formation chaperone FlgA [Pseudolabrys sp.]|jgi:flagella basal body P-ring formation protein FlgA